MPGTDTHTDGGSSAITVRPWPSTLIQSGVRVPTTPEATAGPKLPPGGHDAERSWPPSGHAATVWPWAPTAILKLRSSIKASSRTVSAPRDRRACA